MVQRLFPSCPGRAAVVLPELIILPYPELHQCPQPIVPLVPSLTFHLSPSSGTLDAPKASTRHPGEAQPDNGDPRLDQPPFPTSYERPRDAGHNPWWRRGNETLSLWDLDWLGTA